MNKVFHVLPASKKTDAAILLVRIAIAAMMLTHGLPKMQSLFSGQPIMFVDFLGLGPAVSLTLAVFAEVICSLLILLGLGTRLATLPLIITMLVALVQVHAADVFAKKEMALHYLLVYILLFVLGSGRYAADNLLYHKLALKKAKG